MKVCSPLFAVAIAAAVYAPRVDAACAAAACDAETGCMKDVSVPTATPLVIKTAVDATCSYAKYLSSLKLSAASTDTITVTFSDSLTSTSVDVKDGTTVCTSTYTDVGKGIAGLTKSVEATITCDNTESTPGDTPCTVTYLPTWGCRDPAMCIRDCGDGSTEKTVLKADTWTLTNPDTCPVGHSYLTSLKVGSKASKTTALTIAFGGVTGVTSTSNDASCYFEYGQIPTTGQTPATVAALTNDVTVAVSCPTATTSCVVQAKPVWGCDAPKCTTVVAGGIDQILTAASGATPSFVLKKPDAKTCPTGQIAYPKNLVVGGKYAAHNVAVKFNNGLTPALDVTSVDNCYLAYGANPVGSSPVTTDVTATITCKDTTKPCTAQYKVESWECLTPACLATCTDCTNGPAFTSGKSTITPTSKSCTYGKQYLTAFQATAASGEGIKVAFKHGTTALTPTETGKKTNGLSSDACSWTYADVGKTDTLTGDVGVEVTCADSSATSCPYTYAATWTCQRDPTLCALECDDAAPACADKEIPAGGSLELKNTDDCPTFNYLKSLKIGSKSKKNIAVTFDGASARLPKAKTDSCYFSYGQIPANPTTLLKNVKATVKCADASAACTVQASPTWACDAPKCDKKITSGGTAKTIDAGAKFVISKPSDATACAAGEIAFPKNLIIGGAFTAYSVGVSFNNGLKPTPTDKSGDCYFDYGADPVGTSPVSSDVAVTVTCKDPTKPCNIQYKTEWGCKVPSCQTLCTGDGCTAGTVTTAGTPLTLTAPAATCTGTGTFQYLSAFTVSATNGDPITVKFKDGTTVLSSTETNKTTNGIKPDPCSWTYADVGKTATLTQHVSVDVGCKADTATCAFNYAATWTCQRDPALCAMEAAGSDQSIAANGKVELTNTAECPTFNYLKSLKVGSKAKKNIAVAFTGGGAAPTASPKVDSCYFEYGQTPTDLTALTANVMATVQCAPATDTCTVQAVPEWACAVPSCPKTVTGGVDKTIEIGKNVVYAKASDFTCTTGGKFAYPKGLVVGGKFTPAYDVKVTFDNGLTPKPTVVSGDCYFEFPDPVGTSVVTSDVTATITCKDATKACKVQVKEPTWDCYTPPDLTKVYTRTEADGSSCQDVSTCASRCAKSYAMGKKDGKVTFAPQLVPADCDCPVLTATPAGNGLTATDSGTTMTATFATTDEPSMTIEYNAAGHKCKYTYTKAAFANPFAEKVFKFKSVTPSTDDCILPNDCDYVCAAEMTVAKQGDAIQVSRKPVGDCPCTNTTAYTNDDGETASGSTGPVAYLFDALSATSVSLNTTVDGTTCRLMYEEKPAPPSPAPTDPVTDAPKPSTAPTNAPTNAPSPTTPATTTKTGTSAGVSAMGGGAGAGVTTVTLIAAAAGVQAVGLPAN